MVILSSMGRYFATLVLVLGIQGRLAWHAEGGVVSPAQPGAAARFDGGILAVSSAPTASILTLQTNGSGRIITGFRGNRLVIGKSYIVRALPAAGQIFTGWSGGVQSAHNALQFVMRPDLILVANFAPNPFLSLKGVYTGLFFPGNGPSDLPGEINATNSGGFSLALTSGGHFSGRLLYRGGQLPFTGQFGQDLRSEVTVPFPSRPGAPIRLKLSVDGTAMTGFIAATTWQAGVVAYRAAAGASNSYAGSYNFLGKVCPDCTLGRAYPMGVGAVALKVGSTGNLRMNGAMPDGTLVSQGVTVSGDGWWPMYVSLYGGNGLAIGWIDLNSDVEDDNIQWVMPAGLPGTVYTNGFEYELDTLLTHYVAPNPGQNPVGWTNGVVVLGEGGLLTSLTNQVSIRGNRCYALPGPISKLSLTVSPSTGLFHGSFFHPVKQRMTRFTGALVQQPPEDPIPDGPADSSGWFRASGTCGFILLQGESQAP